MVLHTLKILQKILTTKYPFASRYALAATYIKLVLAATHFAYSRKSNRTSRKPLFKSIFNLNVYFHSYPELLNLFEEIYIFKIYERNKNLSVIMDCGSNIGLSVIYFHLCHPRAIIHAFEPNEKSFDLLRKNITENNLKNITIHNCALGDKNTTSILYNPDANTSINSSLFQGAGMKKIQEVPVRKLSGFINKHVSLLKIDTEGCEEVIIRELAESNKLRTIDYLIIEYHTDINKGAAKFIDYLMLEGYKVRSKKDILHEGATELLIRAERSL